MAKTKLVCFSELLQEYFDMLGGSRYDEHLRVFRVLCFFREDMMCF